MSLNRPRIVSLIASATEIVCALGMREFLVGRSHECDYPEDVFTLPQCTRPKFQLDGSSYDIDQRVKAVLQESLSVYSVDAALLDSLEPTHIITQSQCEVCAVSLKDVERAACEFIRSKPQVVSLEPNRLEDVWQDIRTVGGALNETGRATDLIGKLQGRLQDIRDRNRQSKHRPRMLFVEWIDPLMAGGNWMPTLIETAGAENLFGEVGKHSPPIAWDSVLQADPEIIVVAPCGFDIDRTMPELVTLRSKPGWTGLSAVRSGKVFVADGNQFFNRPGPRLVESAEILEAIVRNDGSGNGFCRVD